MDSIMEEMERISKVREQDSITARKFRFQGADAHDVAEIVESLKQ